MTANRPPSGASRSDAKASDKGETRSDPRLPQQPAIDKPVIEIESFSLWYGDALAIQNVSLQIPERKITALIGPSGCGKSTLLRSINRMNDLVEAVRTEGDIRFAGNSIFDSDLDVHALRRRIGMVFQRSTPFPKSIFENAIYGCKIHGVRDRARLSEIAESSLQRVGLWDEVKDRLHGSAMELSGGQQQRLCIARSIAIEPEIILLDEPCSALDPIATQKIETLMRSLAERYTLIVVTHNMQQAARVSDYTAFLYLGQLIELGDTAEIFVKPKLRQTEDYIRGRFG